MRSLPDSISFLYERAGGIWMVRCKSFAFFFLGGGGGCKWGVGGINMEEALFFKKTWACHEPSITADVSRADQVMVHANNDEMLTVDNWEHWINHNLRPIVRRIRQCKVFKEIFLAVGNESLAPWHVERFGARLAPCLREVHAALVETRLADRVKLVTPLEMSVLGCSYPPSAGQISEAHAEVVKDVVRLLVRIGSPFCINIYPFFAREHASRDFVLFGPDPGYLDCGKRYNNMFSAQYDAVVSALSKLGVLGADAMDVVVTETGWPSGERSVSCKAG